MTRKPDAVPRPISTLLTDTSQTTIFTAADSIAIPTDIHIVNILTAAATATVEYSFSGGTDYKLVNAISVLPNTTGLHLSDDDGLGFQIAPGGKVKVTAGTANALHVTLSVIELSRASG